MCELRSDFFEQRFHVIGQKKNKAISLAQFGVMVEQSWIFFQVRASLLWRILSPSKKRAQVETGLLLIQFVIIFTSTVDNIYFSRQETPWISLRSSEMLIPWVAVLFFRFLTPGYPVLNRKKIHKVGLSSLYWRARKYRQSASFDPLVNSMKLMMLGLIGVFQKTLFNHGPF